MALADALARIPVNKSPTLLDIARSTPINERFNPLAVDARYNGATSEDPWYLEMLNPDKSALGGFLQWIDRPGQVVRNVLRGDIGAAGRQAVDFLGDAADAFLPGDLIGNATTQKDYLQFSDLVGASDLPWYAKLPLDIVGGMATDPLSFLTFGGSGAAANVARAARQAANEGRIAATTSREALKAADSAVEALLNTARGVVSPVGDAAPFVNKVDADALAALMTKRSAAESRLAELASESGKAKGVVDNLPSSAPDESVMLQRQLRQLVSDEASIINATKLRTAQKFGDPAASAKGKGDMVSIWETNLEAGAGKRLAAQGEDAIPGFIRKVADEIGDKTDVEHIRKVLAGHGDAFNQGGVRLINMLGGTRIKAFDTAYDAAVAGLGRTLDRLPPKGREAIKAIGKTTSAIGLSLRKTMGSQWFNINPSTKAIAKQASAQGAAATEHYVSEITKIFNGIDKPFIESTEQAISNVFDNIIDLRKSGGSAEEIIPHLSTKDVGIDDLMQRIEALKGRMPNADKVDWNAVQRIVPEVYEVNKRMLQEGAELGIFDQRMMQLKRGNDSYLFREYTGRTRNADGTVNKDFGAAVGSLEDELLGQGASSTFSKNRTIQYDDDLVRFLNDNPEVALESSAMRRMVKRAERQGGAVARAVTGRGMLGPAYTTVAESAGPVAKMAAAMADVDPQYAAYVKAMTSTLRERRGLMPLLAKVNKAFKPAAVYQLFLPKTASVPRNLVGGAWGAGSVIGWDQAKLQLMNLPRNFVDSLGVYAKQAARGLMGKKDVLDIHAIHGATIANVMGETPKFGGALGDDIRFIASLEGLPMAERLARASARDPILAEAVRHGVLDGYVASEKLLKNHFRSRTANRIADVATAPGAMFAHAEGAMRYATYKALRKQGISADGARQFQNDAFLDYGIDFITNRTLRDIVPFAAFSAGTIAQQSKLIAKRPAVAVAMAQMYGQNEDYPLMPWIQGTPSFTYGTSEDGTPLVAAGMGLPFEALDIIPNVSGNLGQLGESVRKGIVGSSHPLLKYAVGKTMGVDPFFGGPFGAYDATPYSLQALGMSERSEFARRYRELASSGLIQPLVGVMNTFDKMLDPRLDVSSRALNLLTGMRIVANDPDKAAFRILQDKLATDPTVKQSIQYHGGSDEMDDALRALREASKRLKEKREAREQAKLSE